MLHLTLKHFGMQQFRSADTIKCMSFQLQNIMSGGQPYDDPSLKGFSRYFNSSTIRGRANVSNFYNYE